MIRQKDVITRARDKKIIDDATNNYKKAIFSDYSQYKADAYCYITYYQINDAASKEDFDLEAVNDHFGDSSPLKYNKIYDVPLYQCDVEAIMLEIAERGLMSTINGTGEFIPDSLVPVAGEFFVFDIDGMRDHLFQITDVQYSYAGPQKYYRVQFSLYNKNVDSLETSDSIDDEYQMIRDKIGTKDSSVLKKTEYVKAESLQLIVDDIINNYFDDYYDQDMNMFICESNIEVGKKYWSSYLQHFICRNDVMVKYKKELMDSIFLMDINEFEAKNIYDEKTYRKSLFKSVEVQKPIADISSTFMYEGEQNLRTRNLPFFYSTDNYVLLDNGNSGSINLYTNGFPFMFGDESIAFSEADEFHKYNSRTEFMEAIDRIINNNDADEIARIKPGDIVYIFNETDPTIPEELVYFTKGDYDATDGLNFSLIENAEFPGFFQYNDEETNAILSKDSVIFDIIRRYVNKDLTIDEELMNRLNDEYFDKNITNYICLPVIIYILKEKIKEMLE